MPLRQCVPAVWTRVRACVSQARPAGSCHAGAASAMHGGLNAPPSAPVWDGRTRVRPRLCVDVGRVAACRAAAPLPALSPRTARCFMRSPGQVWGSARFSPRQSCMHAHQARRLAPVSAHGAHAAAHDTCLAGCRVTCCAAGTACAASPRPDGSSQLPTAVACGCMRGACTGMRVHGLTESRLRTHSPAMH